VSSSTADTALIVAIGAAVAAGLALLIAIWLFVRQRRLRKGQMVLLGGDQTDLMSYALNLLARVESVEGRATEVETLVDSLGHRVDSCLQQRSLVRYDALDGSGGRQSVSMALLDASGSGFVLTAIQDREYARIYVKELREGEADLELSPEERTAVDEALGS
jgi:HAMP domain-containing protein